MDTIKNRNEINDEYKWDLSKIYKDETCIEKEIKEISSLNRKISLIQGHVMDSSENLLNGLNIYFFISRKLERLAVYSHLLLDEDLNINKNQILSGRIEKIYTDVATTTSYFVPEILESSINKVEEFIKENKNLEEYAFNLKEMFRSKKHSLSKEEEKLMALSGEALLSSSNAYNMLLDTELVFKKIRDENGNLIEFNESKYSKYIKSADRNVRRAAFNSLLETYKNYQNTITETLKGSIKKDTFIAKARNYKSTLHMALDDDNIDIKLYDKLLSTVNNRISASYDYISLKKDELKLDEIHVYDIYASMVNDIKKTYSFNEAKALVLNALSPLGEDYINNLTMIMNSRCIDVFNNKGKASGAYAISSYDTLPYVLTNFEGTYNDVSTIAHELGHAMHFYYSNTNNPYCNSEYTIFLAEIASTVNEILLNRYCYKNSKNIKEKKFFLNNLLDDIRATIIRQTMFAEFEKIIHEKDENKEVLSSEELSNIYYELNKKYYGNVLINDDLIRYEWERIPHFYNSFYVYKYATGMSIALKIASDILEGKENAKENYIEFLKSGGKDYSLNILKNVGIDIINDDTIDKALDIFEQTIKEYKNLG